MASWHGGCQQSGRLDTPVQDTFQRAVEMEWLKMYAGPGCGAWCAKFEFYPGHSAELCLDLLADMRLAHKNECSCRK